MRFCLYNGSEKLKSWLQSPHHVLLVIACPSIEFRFSSNTKALQNLGEVNDSLENRKGVIIEIWGPEVVLEKHLNFMVSSR